MKLSSKLGKRDMTSLRDTLQGALVMAPMTKGSNLPYRRLCQELGARVTMSEMTVARRLKQKRRGEFALIRRAPDERFFGVQLAGNKPDEMAWAAELVESRGADLVDVNLGCPIDYFTSKGLGAALAREPRRVRPHRRGDETGGAADPGHREDPPRLERRAPELPRRRARGGRGGRRRDLRARPHARGPIHDVGRLERDRRSRGRSAGAGHRQRRPAVPARGRRRAAHRLHGRHVGARRADQAVAVPRSHRGRSAIRPATNASRSTGVTSRSPSRTGATTSAASDGSASSCCGTSGSGADTRRGAPTGRIPAMQRRESWMPRSPLEALLARSDAPAHEYLADRLLSEAADRRRRSPGPGRSARDRRRQGGGGMKSMSRYQWVSEPSGRL